MNNSTLAAADDGRIVSSEFGYSNTTNKTCQTLSLAVQDLDVKDDAVFFAYISLPAESLLELGAVGSASITLQGGRDEVNDDGGDGGKDGGGKDDGGKDGGGKDDGSTGQFTSPYIDIVIILEGCAPLGALCVMLKHLVYLET